MSIWRRRPRPFWRARAGLPLLVAPLLVAPLLTACDDASEPASGVQVAAAFYPLAWVAERVGGPDVSVTNLTTPGGEPHDLELTVNETLSVARADLVVYERGFQPAVDDVIANVTEGRLLDAADVVGLRPGPGGEPDPHFWLDPIRMAELAGTVADELGRIDPAHRAAYADRAASLRGELEALDRSYQRGLTGCARATIVVSHDAFGYLGRYGLTIESITGLSPDAEPSPADLGRLHDLVTRTGITTVFSETLVSPRLAETLARDTGVRTAVLDPIEGLAAGPGAVPGADYLTLMRANLTALEEANGC